VEVDAGGVEVCVPEDGLDRAEIEAPVEEIGRQAVTKGVTGAPETCSSEVSLDDVVEAPPGEWSPPSVDEDRIVGGETASKEWTQGLKGPLGEGNEPLSAALAMTHEDRVGSNVFEDQSQEFGSPEARGHQDLENGSVTRRETR
jgi:hypothetical protein